MKNDRKEYYALVTGASRGLGKEIAIELAKQNHHVLLVALKNEGLTDLSEDIQNKYGVKTAYYEVDLAESNGVFELVQWALNNFNIDVLINNAGLGGTANFEEVSPAYIEKIIMLNIRALSLLTRLLLPELKKHDKSYILNVASMASFSPIAFKTVYPASKAFVYSFSRGLSEELKNTGVFVSVLHPGPIATNPDVIARIKKQGVFGKIGLVAPCKLARIAVRQLFRNDVLVIPGLMNKLNWILIKTIPIWIRLPLVSNIVKKNELVTQQI